MLMGFSQFTCGIDQMRLHPDSDSRTTRLGLKRIQNFVPKRTLSTVRYRYTEIYFQKIVNTLIHINQG